LYCERHGRWPQRASGLVEDAPRETWLGVDTALRSGRRGLPGGSSLARLIREHRTASLTTLLDERMNAEEPDTFRKQRPPVLDVEQLLAWADAHHERTGQWPTGNSGPILGAAREKWSGVDRALLRGYRGLPGGSSLARLLAHHRGVRNRMDLPNFTVDQILAWADAHHARTGEWPTHQSGPIPESPGDTWAAVRGALNSGARGLPGGSSLARLLTEQRGVRNRHGLSALTEDQVLAWADAYFERAGRWPTLYSGPVDSAPGETWNGVDKALRRGRRGLPANSSLAQLLAVRRGARNQRDLPALTAEQILAWADVYHERTVQWPLTTSGPIEGTPGETWSTVNSGLMHGGRGLAGGTSLPRFLAEHRGVRNRKDLPDLSLGQILAWADAHFASHGRWPHTLSGALEGAPGETWLRVDTALRVGYRGLPGRSSLHRLLREHRQE
jgi:hypothetical protein